MTQDFSLAQALKRCGQSAVVVICRFEKFFIPDISAFVKYASYECWN